MYYKAMAIIIIVFTYTQYMMLMKLSSENETFLDVWLLVLASWVDLV
jgi:hypothetical protein